MSDSLWPMDYGLPGSSVLEVSQTRIWKWVVISFFRGSLHPEIKPVPPTLAGGSLTAEPLGKHQSGILSIKSCTISFDSFFTFHSWSEWLFFSESWGPSYAWYFLFSSFFLPSHSPCFFFKISIYVKWELLPNCGTQSSHCSGFSWCRAWTLGTRASVVVAHELSSCGSGTLRFRLSGMVHWFRCPMAHRIFLDQGSSLLCPLHW